MFPPPNTQIHWGQHHLRPEFIESTYFLYKATGDHYYLQAAKKVLQALQRHARVPCGFAAVNDLRTGKHEDRMDSFVLSETLKYLFLIFADPSELILDLDAFVFTTEAHLLPLSLGQLTNATATSVGQDDIPAIDFMRTCPSPNKLFPESVRRPLRDLVTGTCPRVQNAKRLRASEFQVSSIRVRRRTQQLLCFGSYLIYDSFLPFFMSLWFGPHCSLKIRLHPYLYLPRVVE